MVQNLAGFPSKVERKVVSTVAQNYPILVMFKCGRVLILLALCVTSLRGGAEEYSEEERLLGFTRHRQRNEELDRQRESGADAVKKARAKWEEELNSSVDEYKEWKSHQAAALDERSPEYKEDLAEKKELKEDHEEARQEFVRERDRLRAKRKVTVHLTEEHEYGLDEVPDLVDIRKRALYNSNASLLKGGRGGRGGPSFGGGTPGRGGAPGGADFGAPPPEYNPPVSAAPPAAPEFFEPEIPPPPPPMEFEENVPPPVFDDPEF
jgi:hypothetical protein